MIFTPTRAAGRSRRQLRDLDKKRFEGDAWLFIAYAVHRTGHEIMMLLNGAFHLGVEGQYGQHWYDYGVHQKTQKYHGNGLFASLEDIVGLEMLEAIRCWIKSPLKNSERQHSERNMDGLGASCAQHKVSCQQWDERHSCSTH